MKKKTIIFYIATLTRGGAERVMANLANYFSREGYRVLLLTLEEDEGLYPMEKEIEMRVLSLPKTGGRLKHVVERILQVRRILKETEAFAMVSFIGKTNLRAVLAGLGLKTKVFVSVRSAPAREYPGVQSFLAKFLFGFSGGVIFQTEEARDFFPARVRKKSRILKNPLSEEYVREPYRGKRENRIVTVGRMDKVKNHMLLVEAFALVEKTHPEMCLEICGDGDCMQEVRERAKALGIADKVLLPGDCKNVVKKIERAKVFVLSSDFEGMPNAVAEAQALGIPVVSTDCPSGGAKALVKNEDTGLLVPVGDAQKMAGAILRVLEEEGLAKRLSENGNSFARTLYPDKIHKMWKNYIEDVCKI